MKTVSTTTGFKWCCSVLSPVGGSTAPCPEEDASRDVTDHTKKKKAAQPSPGQQQLASRQRKHWDISGWTETFLAVEHFICPPLFIKKQPRDAVV